MVDTCEICGAEVITDWRIRKTCGNLDCQKELKKRYQNNRYDSAEKMVEELGLDD